MVLARLRSLATFLAVAASSIASFVVPSVAHADDVLVFQRWTNDLGQADQAGAEAASVLTDLGHQVTLVSEAAAVLPADLTLFDAVWVVNLAPLTGFEETALAQFALAGGGLLITGERACCESLNGSMQGVLNLALIDNIQVGGLGEGGDAFDFSATAPAQIASSPNVLTEWTAGAAGLAGAIAAENVVATNAAGGVGMAAWLPEDLDEGSGCVTLLMDLTWWLPQQVPPEQRESVAANLQTFLLGCGDSDGDGISDAYEGTIATDPNDPDSDGDGLCDGWGTVTGTCVAGEGGGSNEDWDGDGTIDALDADDDGDGLSTADELAYEMQYPDIDGDDNPVYNDLDSDDDLFVDSLEGELDNDGDGIPAFLDEDEYPEPCRSDAECGEADSGIVCNDTTGYCQAGCRGEGGNGCPAGATCTSTDATIGECMTEGQGGAGPGGAGGRGEGAGSGSVGAGGGSGTSGLGASGSGGSPGSGATESDGGCGCKLAASGRDAASLAWLGVLGALFGLRRRRR
jgi:hypothetical protein